MKQCGMCKEYKDVSEFNKKSSTKDGFQRHCRQCSKSKYKTYYNTNKDKEKSRTHTRTVKLRQWIQELKLNLACEVCGENDPCCLDFHHKDPNQKDFIISLAAQNGYSIQRIEQEISKCKILCSNCHRKLHAGHLEI